jgi:hypothetical protein
VALEISTSKEIIRRDQNRSSACAILLMILTGEMALFVFQATGVRYRTSRLDIYTEVNRCPKHYV